MILYDENLERCRGVTWGICIIGGQNCLIYNFLILYHIAIGIKQASANSLRVLSYFSFQSRCTISDQTLFLAPKPRHGGESWPPAPAHPLFTTYLGLRLAVS